MNKISFSYTQKILSLVIVLSFFMIANGQNTAQTRKILDKTASVVGRAGGTSANFSMSNAQVGKTSGTIAIKGNKFHARTPEAIVWFDGKTQWSYLKQTNEVNVSTPSHTQQISMNPYTFINMYKSGYQLSHKIVGNHYQVRMVATNKQNGIPEMYISINRKNFNPTQVKIKQNNTWTTINISNFKAKDLPNNLFTFQRKDLPTAEIIDLR